MPGILCFQVVVGPEFVVPPYSKVSLFQQPIEEDSDEELEYADSTSGIVYSPAVIVYSPAVKLALQNVIFIAI